MRTKFEIKNNLKSNVEGWNWKQNLIRKMIQKKKTIKRLVTKSNIKIKWNQMIRDVIEEKKSIKW
jgi:hypothetical protein